MSLQQLNRARTLAIHSRVPQLLPSALGVSCFIIMMINKNRLLAPVRVQKLVQFRGAAGGEAGDFAKLRFAQRRQ